MACGRHGTTLGTRRARLGYNDNGPRQPTPSALRTPEAEHNIMSGGGSSIRRDPGYVGLTTLVDSLPAPYYFDPAHHSLEMNQIWYRNWIYVCRSSDLATVRSYRTLELGTQSILVVRGEDRVVRAFHNTCRHRGSALCQTPEGRFPSSGIVCPYHSWRYSLRGELVQAGSGQHGEGFELRDFPLYSLPVTEWNGCIFA